MRVGIPAYRGLAAAHSGYLRLTGTEPLLITCVSRDLDD
jgi:hypothetical protein